MKRRSFLLTAALCVLVPVASRIAAAPLHVEVYKQPGCGCCVKWADHLRDSGFAVTVHEMGDLAAFRAKAGVPASLASCHTALIDGYVIEGHVPAKEIARLLAERPKARGLAVPGMPMGAPGMEAPRGEPFDVLLIGQDGTTRVFQAYKKT